MRDNVLAAMDALGLTAEDLAREPANRRLVVDLANALDELEEPDPTPRQVLDLAVPMPDPEADTPFTPEAVRLRRGPEMDHFRANYGR